MKSIFHNLALKKKKNSNFRTNDSLLERVSLLHRTVLFPMFVPCKTMHLICIINENPSRKLSETAPVAIGSKVYWGILDL